MADNLVLNAGAGGATMGTDEVNIGGTNVHVQYVKILDGTADGTTRLAVGANGQATDVKAIAAGANKIGDVGIGTRASGGPTSVRDLDAKATTGVNVKASGGQVYFIHVTNTRTTALYLKLYNKSSAPTSGDTPQHTFLVPTQGDSKGAGFCIAIPHGIQFSTGIGYRATTGLGDADNNNPGTNECILNLTYA
jgi:hypothetical protein